MDFLTHFLISVVSYWLSLLGFALCRFSLLGFDFDFVFGFRTETQR